ncbi:MAG TPA: SCO family protein [Stellaceae bacterium]|nr:SCO family protein [Stellaceae bacterium]
MRTFAIKAGIAILAGIGVVGLLAGPRGLAHETPQGGADGGARAILFDQPKALAYSQQAIGRKLDDYRFVTSRGEAFQLSATRGKPLVVTLIYTSCTDACPLTVQTLARAVEVAASAVKPDSFTVLAIGFDSHADTPQRMHEFARRQGIDDRTWRFLSADAATIDGLTKELGFLYAANAGGFDHLSQTSLVDAEGRVYRQIYGTNFAPQLLVEPLKELVFGSAANSSGLSGLLDRVKLLCTVYDPTSGRYRFSYAIFVEIIVGGLSLAAVAAVVLRLWLQARPRRSATPL